MPPHLSLDGHPKELEFPDLKNCYEIKCEENLFESIGGGSNVNLDHAAIIDDKQLEHLQEELENHKCKILSKDSSISLLKNRIESKDQEINQLRSQMEKLNRSIKDLS